jgi:hypothetical protein
MHASSWFLKSAFLKWVNLCHYNTAPTFAFLADEFGLEGARTIFGKAPHTIGFTQDFMRNIFNFLIGPEGGLSREVARTMVIKQPWLLTLDLEGNIRPTVGAVYSC